MPALIARARVLWSAATRFNFRLALAGDSHTSGPHSHDINLIYERQPAARWRFVQDCPAPDSCYRN